MYYWASSSGKATEVDFLLFQGEESIAVEVKSGRHFSENWCKGLRAVAELKGLRRRIAFIPKARSCKPVTASMFYPSGFLPSS